MTAPVQMPVPPLSSPLPVDEEARAQWTKPWANWITVVWQQLLALFTFTATISTTNASATTLAAITIPPMTTALIEARVVARRTGGASGAAEDGASYVIYASYKNVAGVAVEIGETAVFTAEDQGGWACTFSGSGSDALLRVTGAANNDVDWFVQYRVTATPKAS